MTTTTTNPSPESRKSDRLKPILLAALIVGICWAGVISYWQATDRTPSASDMVVFLLALPLALIMSSGFARTRIAKPAVTPEVATSSKPVAAINVQPPLALVASALRLPHGESAEELSAAIGENKARADLDPELVDEDGFPVMTLRSGDADDAALQEEIAEWWSANGLLQLSVSDEQWRALNMGTAVTGDLASTAASDLMPAEGPPPILQLLPILPKEWPADHRRAAALWLKHTVAQFGWPLACIELADENPETPSAILRRLAHETVTGTPLVALIVACASNIGDESVAQWAASRCLFTAAQPNGLIPGEGAAALLLTNLQQARALEGVDFALLDPVSEARRELSADETRQTESTLLAELAERATRNGAARLPDAAMLVADTGHRSNRVLELMGFASEAMPQLDSATDVIRVGAATGTCGAVPFMTALALGRHHALERAAAVLCISNEDPYQRCAALIRPYASA